MKTFREFCSDANIYEFWNPFASKPKPNPKPPQQPVLAHKNYQQGFGSGKNWKPGTWTPEQQARYGYKPVKVSAYDPTGNVTASGKPFTTNTPPSVAVPYVSKTNKKPTIPFGTKIDFTTAPMGRNTKSTSAEVTDTGNFGRKDSESTNANVFADVSPTLRNKLVPGTSSTEFGKPMVYAKVTPPKSNIPDLGIPVDMTIPKIVPLRRNK